MRKAAHERRVESDPVELQSDVFDLIAPFYHFVHHRRFADDIDHPLTRIKRRVGILKDHLHLELLRTGDALAGFNELRAPPKAHAGGRGQQACSDPSQRRLAASRLADQPDYLALQNHQVDAIDGMDRLRGEHPFEHASSSIDPIGMPGEAFGDAFELQQRCCRGGRGRHDSSRGAFAAAAWHMATKASSMSRAKARPSVNREPLIVARSSARSRASRAWSAASAQAMRT